MGLKESAWADPKVDHTVYAKLLKKYVRDGFVDYKGLKTEEAQLDAYLRLLDKTDTKALSRNEQFAFYVNAYNAWTIKLILSAYPGIESIWDLGSRILPWKSPFKKKLASIEGEKVSLDDIEHGILRPRFRDPRVHFAVNCASRSCPPLRSEPYRGEILDEQLDDATRSFLNDSKHNRLEDNTLYVSEIFKWFAGDFDNDVVGFFLRYAQGDLKRRLEADKGNIKVRYLDYDWSLNGK
jgi:hypothetical protein